MRIEGYGRTWYTVVEDLQDEETSVRLTDGLVLLAEPKLVSAVGEELRYAVDALLGRLIHHPKHGRFSIFLLLHL